MKSVIKGAGYILVHTPDMVIHNGTTQTTERIVNPESEYLKELPGHIRSFEDVLSYYPNQVYIGNVTPDELAEVPQPWCDKVCPKNGRFGQFGQMMPQEEFLLLMQACDVFELVYLDKDFVAENKAKLAENPLIDETIMARVNDGIELSEIERLVSEEHSEGLYHHDKLVGCVKRAHDIDVNLSAHVMHENIADKASSVLALLAAVKNAGIAKEDVEYVIDCAEEACGDMNQRGGGNFAKSAAEIAGLTAGSYDVYVLIHKAGRHHQAGSVHHLHGQGAVGSFQIRSHLYYLPAAYKHILPSKMAGGVNICIFNKKQIHNRIPAFLN